MIFKGYKINVRCLNWEQVERIGAYWNKFNSVVKSDKIVGLGIDPLNKTYFDYALGVIDDEDTLNKIKNIDFSDTDFETTYIEVDLPDFDEWEKFSGNVCDIADIYDKQIDCNNRYYDYELEYIDTNGKIEIKIHYID